MSTATTHASSSNAPLSSLLARPLRTLNNIYSTSHVIQLHPNNSPKLSEKRKTAVELLEESKAFYVKTERVLDRKQELPHYSPGDRLLLLQHHPNRSPMLSLPSARIHREHFAFPLANLQQQQQQHHHLQQDQHINNNGHEAQHGGIVRSGRQRDGYYGTPPVEKRRLSIRKDNPLPLNVTAVKRFLSRPASAEENLTVRKMVVPSKTTCRLIGFFESNKTAPVAATASALSSSSSNHIGSSLPTPPRPFANQNKKIKSRITFSEVLPCICQSSQPPELPHRMNKNHPSPPPPIPPKSPALKLRLLSQEQSQPQYQTPAPPPPQQKPTISSIPVGTSLKVNQPTTQATKSQAFRRIQSEEAPRSLTIFASTTVVPEIHNQRHLVRNPVLHKSLPDLNSPKTSRRSRACGGKIRSASTDLESCSDADSGSSRISRSSSVHLDSGSSSSSDDESSNESDTPFSSRPGVRSVGANRSERATTSDYASRSPSFKYETTSLVQTSQNWTLPPWQDDSGVDPSAAESSTVEPSPREEQVRRKAFILRSKSDVGPSRFAPDLLPAVPPEFTGDVPLDLDRFFDTIGNQRMMADGSDDATRSGRSSPVYFSSVSSVDSFCKRRHHVDNIYESSDSEDLAATLQRRLLGSQPGMGEPSIVERNARIIKWLIKCRNVPAIIGTAASSMPSSGSTGQLAKLAAAASATACVTGVAVPTLTRSNTLIPTPKPASLYYGQSTRL